MSFATETSTGHSTQAVRTQLGAQGNLDLFLTCDPTLTYWRAEYETHTPFALDHYRVQIANAAWGQNVTEEFIKAGDGIHRLFLSMEVPALYCEPEAAHTTPYAYKSSDDATTTGIDESTYEESGSTNYWAHWVDGAGFVAVEKFGIQIGTATVDEVTTESMFMTEELCGKAGKRVTDMVGKYGSTEMLIAKATRPQLWQVPIPLWCAEHSSNMMSTSSLNHNKVRAQVKFRPLRDMVVVSHKNIKVYAGDANGNKTEQLLSNNNLSAAIVSETVHLGGRERQLFREFAFDQLVKVHQNVSAPFTPTSGATTIDLELARAVTELRMCFRLKSNSDANDWLNFSRCGHATGTGAVTNANVSTRIPVLPQYKGPFMDLVNADAPISNEAGRVTFPSVETQADPLRSFKFQMSAQTRTAELSGQELRQAFPYMYHSAIPSNFVYNYCYGLHPESDIGSGSLNFARVTGTKVIITMDPSLAGVEMEYFLTAMTWNVFNYDKGTGGMLVG